jgi:hypothetical protein
LRLVLLLDRETGGTYSFAKGPSIVQRIFTIEEVDALIPELSHRVSLLLALGAEIEGLVRRLSRETGRPVASLDPGPEEAFETRTLRGKIRDFIVRYEKGWSDIQDLGAIVKDTSMGLLDFYGRLEGRLVWLCWRYGEDRLGYYHELDTGFSGRRSLGAEARGRVLN